MRSQCNFHSDNCGHAIREHHDYGQRRWKSPENQPDRHRHVGRLRYDPGQYRRARLHRFASHCLQRRHRVLGWEHLYDDGVYRQHDGPDSLPFRALRRHDLHVHRSGGELRRYSEVCRDLLYRCGPTGFQRGHQRRDRAVQLRHRCPSGKRSESPRRNVQRDPDRRQHHHPIHHRQC